MLFHVPKGLEVIATGTKQSEKTDGKTTTTEWKTEVPLAVVGFSLGKFTMKEAKLEDKQGNSLTIDAYANTQTPDSYTNQIELPQLNHTEAQDPSQLGTVNTASMLPVQLSQGEAAAKIYSTYFGQLPFNHIALTQQYACNYGQSWPMLVYLPICGFIDSTMLNFHGINPADMYWKTVTPHEVAHQWWGQTVGFRSYRDQWMSEGFAQTSASIFLQKTRSKQDDFREFWKEQRRLITEKNAMGFRPIDVGPVTMGFRLSTQKTGWDIYQNLVYPKGAYILHMIRMMMWSSKDGDQRFIETMHDFLSSYRLQAATTEEFKAVVEKHMSAGMNLDNNQRMDWFFNQYVYGTELPAYHFESQVTQNGDATSLHFKLTQSEVSSSFRMLVPIYLELADGRVTQLGSARITGVTTLEQTVALPKQPSPVKRALINYNYDVLAIEN
jgi:aminopeptidase N